MFTRKEIDLLLNILSQVQIPISELEKPDSVILGVRDRLKKMRIDLDLAEKPVMAPKVAKPEDAVASITGKEEVK